MMRLLLFAGFLGSGKTTVILSMATRFSRRSSSLSYGGPM